MSEDAPPADAADTDDSRDVGEGWWQKHDPKSNRHFFVHGETGHIACCLLCARALQARGASCPVCRLPVDVVIQHFFA